MGEDLRAQLEPVILPFFAEAGLDLVDLKVRQYQGTTHIEVLADRPQGGITIDECAGLNRRINRTLEENQIIPGDYAVDVSSPGLDWPLKTKKDFLRILNREVRFILEKTPNLKGEYVGIVRDAGDDEVHIEWEGQPVTIPVRLIKKAVQNI